MGCYTQNISQTKEEERPSEKQTHSKFLVAGRSVCGGIEKCGHLGLFDLGHLLCISLLKVLYVGLN